MKTSFLLCLFIISTPAFAYSHVSNGAGISCFLSIAFKPISDHGCNAAVVKETSTDEHSRDVNHQRIFSTERLVEDSNCLDTKVLASIDALTDFSQNQTLKIALSPGQAFTNASAVYKDVGGNQDVEARPGIRNYITYAPTTAATAIEATKASALVNSLLGALTLSYDAVKHAASITVDAQKRSQSITIPADFSRGVRTQTVSLAVELDRLDDGRLVAATAGCTPTHD
jgi:hypothetical protein